MDLPDLVVNTAWLFIESAASISYTNGYSCDALVFDSPKEDYNKEGGRIDGGL